MLNCFSPDISSAIPIKSFDSESFNGWLEQQSPIVKNWVNTTGFTAKPETFCLIPDEQGKLAQVLLGIKNPQDFWSFGILSTALPPGNYRLDITDNYELTMQRVMAWGLGAYQYTRYKTSNKTIAQLVIPENCDSQIIENTVAAIYLTRDLINTPPEDMGPEQLAQAAAELAQKFKADITQIIGDDLLKNNYPTIHAVGRASNRAPRLIDLQWGNSQAPKITLVGKGVCFDSGGLDIKTASGMELMKKDMGGAATVLGLAHMIMAMNLPVRLRVLIPAVENVISANAYKPSDVIKTRQGLTVEVGNTDAEGRLILCDALAEAVTENPDLLLDFATLTGAARIAVGTEISALFTNNDELAAQFTKHSEQEQDPIWRLPLHTPYRKMIDSKIADINNAGSSGYAGAITAALFLKEFVPDTTPWVHFDLMGWNSSARPGRPEGGEAMAIRAVFAYLLKHYFAR